MFDGCSNLASIDVNFTDWYSITATEYWLDNVASIGTFRCPQALIDNTTERGGNTVPESWNMVAV